MTASMLCFVHTLGWTSKLRYTVIDLTPAQSRVSQVSQVPQVGGRFDAFPFCEGSPLVAGHPSGGRVHRSAACGSGLRCYGGESLPSCAAREPRAAWLFFAVSSEDFDPSLSTAHWTLVIAPFPLSSARVWP